MTSIKNFRVDSFVSGLAIKAPVNVATDLPITLNAEQTVNGIALLVGDRCLVKDQADPIENGIYNVETSDWQRAGDMDGNRDIVGGTVVPAYRQSDGVFVYYIIDGTPDALEPNVDALSFLVFYDPASGITPTLQSVTDVGAVTDNVIQTGTIFVAKVDGGEILCDWDAGAGEWLQLGAGTGTASRVTATGGNLEFVASGGSVSVIGGSSFQVIAGGTIYIQETANANLDLTGYGQFWTRDDAPGQTPMWTGDDGVDHALNVAPSFSAPLVLLDDEYIELGTSTDATIRWTPASLPSAEAGLEIDMLAVGSTIALLSAPKVRFYNNFGTGYVQIENTGVLALSNLEWTSSGGLSNIDYDAGPWDHNDNRFLHPLLDDFAWQHQTAGSVAGTLDLDFENGNSVFVALTENVTTVTFSNPPVSGGLGILEVELLQDNPARTVTWPAAVIWAGGSPPVLTTVDSEHRFRFTTRNGGTKIFGFHYGAFS
jgi:hypothetical protein